MVVRHGSRCAEALLQLPTIPVRSCNEGPAGLWLTVGLLAADGLALQLRLKKAEQVRGAPGGVSGGGGRCAARMLCCVHVAHRAGMARPRPTASRGVCVCLQPTERDKVEGVWYAYHAVGGAITLLQPAA